MTEVVINQATTIDVNEAVNEIVIQEVQQVVDASGDTVLQIIPGSDTTVIVAADSADVIINTDPLEILEVAQQGPMGPPGPPGGGGTGGSDANVYFTQNTPSTLWTIIHNLGKYPAVTVLDTSHRQVFATVTYPTLNQVSIQFAIPTMGTATLN